MMSKKSVVIAALLAVFASAGVAAASPLEGGAAPIHPTAQEGKPCQDDGTLNDISATKPLLCADGMWRKVVFKDTNGNVSPLFYQGKCSLRFEPDSETRGKIVMKAGEMADVCLPLGWKAHLGATSNGYDWVFNYPPSMPNVVLLKPGQEGSVSKLWIYPVTQDGKMAEKIEVELRTTK